MTTTQVLAMFGGFLLGALFGFCIAKFIKERGNG